MDDLKLIREAMEEISNATSAMVVSAGNGDVMRSAMLMTAVQVHSLQALAALDRIEKQEPYGWVVCYQGGDPFLVCSEHDLPKDKHAAIAPLYTTPPAAPAVPGTHVTLPKTITPEMAAVIRNEHEVYETEQDLFDALVAAAPKPEASE